MILNEIALKRRERIDALKAEKPMEPIRRLAEELASREAAAGLGVQPENFAFEQALRNPKTPGMAFICEVKKASPSKGVIAEHFQFLEIAQEYESAGASAISCLTEPDWFLGRDEYLQQIAATVQIPVLRKDFTIDAYQIYEAKTLGASAVLLICALLETAKLREFLEIAHSLRLAALVEAHSAEEVESALNADARIIGVNNRDLKTFKVDVFTSLRLRPLVPADRVFVSESGIKTAEQIADLRNAGVNGVLIGETFMRSENKKELLRSFC